VIRTRFDEPTVAAMLEVRWWDWDVEKITRNLAAIIGTDIQRLQSCT
jgi:virginiamycin A acetyltransferase